MTVIPLPVKPIIEVREPLPPLSKVRLHLVHSTDDCLELLRWASNKRELAIDTETTGLDKRNDRVRLVQVGDEMDGWAVPFERAAMVIDDLVARFEGTWDMHNAPYDWTMLAKSGVMIAKNKIHDTRIMAHVLSSTAPLALKPLAQLHVDPMASAAQQELQAGIAARGGWTWENVPIDYKPYWTYGALDPILTKRLKDKLYPQVQATAPLSYQLEMHTVWVCLAMELKGARIDRDYTEQYARTLDEYIGQVEAWSQQHYGFSPGSQAKVCDQLIADGVPLTARTKTGWKLDKYILDEIDFHPLALAVRERRKSQKTVGYLHSYLDLADEDDRIHPSINTVGGTHKNPFESGGTQGVRTGRMSCSEPNLQNVPIRTSASKRIRNCFIPTDPEYAWLKVDFDQIEMRIFSHLSEDPSLLASFDHTDIDVFTAMARDMFHDPALVKEDPRRQTTKNANYAIIYGAGLEQFARTAGLRYSDGTLDLTSANMFLATLHDRFPGIRELQRRIDAQGQATKMAEGEAYVRSHLTSRRFVADDQRGYTLLNYLIQGMAAEVLKMKIVQVADAGLVDYMLFPVHDEIDFDIPLGQLSEAVHIVQQVMNDNEIFRVPITATASVGNRWGEVEDL